MTAPLSADQFDAFFTTLWGHAPFPWQRDLAQEVCTTGNWPEGLALPTGAGKTAALDIALFHLALQADQGAARTAPCRIALVVDRRLVVDGAYTRACTIAEKLRTAQDGILATVAKRLRDHLAGRDADPVQAVRLRGGLPFEPDWARTPSQPTLLISTVDQVGSRLLFRGYGLNNRMWPIHAGLLGRDTLYLLDEAHLSQPFAETLRAVHDRIAKEGGGEGEDGAALPARPPQQVEMTATPLEGDNRLTKADEAHDALGPRLAASKPARLHDAKTGAQVKDHPGRPERKFVEALAETAWNLSPLARETERRKTSPCPEVEPPRIIGVVVNRVALARAVKDKLAAWIGDNDAPASVQLCIGRTRPLDRADRQAGLDALLADNRTHKDDEGITFLVATQTVEVGADLDLDALVTQAAPLDCLRQRFGRLNRLGNRETSPAVIVMSREDQKKPDKADDPLYGTATAHTVEWLHEQAQDKVVDFGLAHLPSPGPERLPKLVAPREAAPLLLPAYIEKWRKTAPAPGADPETALFLHGAGHDSAEVTLIWRDDLPDLQSANKDTPGNIQDLLQTFPPTAPEGLSVPVGAARAWLRRTGLVPLADVEGERGEGASDAEAQGDRITRVIRWRGDTAEIIPVNRIMPGDTVVLPADLGGCDADGWAPDQDRRPPPVTDLATRALLRQRGRLHLRITKDRLDATLPPDVVGVIWPRVQELLDDRKDTPAETVEALKSIDAWPDDWRVWLKALKPETEPTANDKKLWQSEHPCRKGLILGLHRRLTPAMLQERAPDLARREKLIDSPAGAPATESDAGSFRAATVTLADHCKDVARTAQDLAKRAGLPPEVFHDIALAGTLHDLGKAEPRFQILLHGGDELAALGAAEEQAFLAKGADTPPRLRRWARAVAGLPRGARHECWSVRLAAQHPRLEEAQDPELVIWLIGTHHGHGRPFFPPLAEATDARIELPLDDETALNVPVAHGLQRADSGWSERMRRLEARYGVWGLAHLEAVLRLADHRVSEAESQGKAEGGA